MILHPRIAIFDESNDHLLLEEVTVHPIMIGVTKLVNCLKNSGYSKSLMSLVEVTCG
jgi:hypothetical protein